MKYTVYVSNAKGWEDDCPDYEGVFFGNDHGGEYVRCCDGPRYAPRLGFVVVNSKRAAMRLCRDLNASGDWDVNGVEEHPIYDVCAVSDWE